MEIKRLIFQIDHPFNPISYGLSDSVARTWLWLLWLVSIYSICMFVYLRVTWTENSKFEQDFRISKLCEIKILHQIDKQKIAITTILYAGIILIVEQIMFCNIGSTTNFHFFSTPLRGGEG